MFFNPACMLPPMVCSQTNFNAKTKSTEIPLKLIIQLAELGLEKSLINEPR